LNNYRVDGAGKFNAAAPGALFLLSLDKSAGDKWKQDVNYFKFKVPISEPSRQNGLSMPALVMASDGAVRYAYARRSAGQSVAFRFHRFRAVAWRAWRISRYTDVCRKRRQRNAATDHDATEGGIRTGRRIRGAIRHRTIARAGRCGACKFQRANRFTPFTIRCTRPTRSADVNSWRRAFWLRTPRLPLHS